MNYRKGLAELKRRTKSTDLEQDFLLFESRMRENLYNEAEYGSNEQVRSDKKRIIEQLNRVAMHFQVSFEELCK